MSIIKKMDFESVEKTLKNIVEVSSQVRLMQEQLEATVSHISNNENYYKLYGTSKENFEENRDYLEKNRRRFMSSIVKSVKLLLKNVDTLGKKISSSKI